MKIAIRIFFIFCLLFVLAGAGCMGAGFVLGGSFEEVSRIGGEAPLDFWKNDVVRRLAGFSFAWRSSREDAGGTAGINGTGVSFSQVDNLRISVTAGALEILEGEGEEIFVESSSDRTKAELVDGTLTVQDSWKGWHMDQPVTQIKIPAGYSFKKITLTGAGGEITSGDLTAGSLLIEANASDITIDGRQAAWTPTGVLNSNAGDIDVTFEGNRSDYDVSATSNMGDIEVEDEGDEEPGRSPAGQIEAKSNMGNIDIGFEKQD